MHKTAGKNYLSFLKCSFKASLKLAKESIRLILPGILFYSGTALYIIFVTEQLSVDGVGQSSKSLLEFLDQTAPHI